MKKSALLILSATVALAPCAFSAEAPIIPGTQWKVHDPKRPQPKVVTPGVPSIQEKAGTAPSDAVVLFAGKDLSAWKSIFGGKDPTWKIADDYTEAVPGVGGIATRAKFGPDVQLHLEFATPPPQGESQGRGNGGVFFFGRYEIQILDSYENKTYPDGQAAAIYGQTPPLVNASLPPGKWQTYDIVFIGPRFKDNQLETPAYVTIFHNGVLVQHNTKLIGNTPHGAIGKYEPHGEKGELSLQEHGNPTRFRNIWIRELKPVDSE